MRVWYYLTELYLKMSLCDELLGLFEAGEFLIEGNLNE